jgi:3'-5' exoribonuclease
VSVKENGIVLVQRIDVRKTRKDENFATLTLGLGRSHDFQTVDAKIWQSDKYTREGRELPRPGALIDAVYRVDEYKGAPQWVLDDFRILEGAPREKALPEFIADVTIDRAFYIKRLEALLEEVDPQKVSARILMEIFDRASFREAFYKAPAAISHHQNYEGGLLEHTLNVTGLALALADAYAPGPGGLTVNSLSLPFDRTLLIAAGLLHDIGKLDTYRLDMVVEVTEANSFEGHLPISYAIVREVAMPLKNEPPYEGAADEIDKLLNCILSHHGRLEFGSPVHPACIEAYLLSQADVTDARIASILSDGTELRRRDPNARFLRHFHFPGGVFIGDWPGKDS